MLKQNKFFLFLPIVIFLIIIGLSLCLSNIIHIYNINYNENFSKNSMNTDNVHNIEVCSFHDESNIDLFVKITDQQYGIKEVNLPNGSILYCDNKFEVAFDYIIDNINEEYNFSYINGNNDEITFKKKFYEYFSYTGNYQTYIAPETGNYTIECLGASGYNNSGKGAYTSGVLSLEKNQQIYIYVGEGNKSSGTTYNGGGSGCYGSGGGATDIRLQNGLWDDFDSLKSRIMVAAGGGGQGGQSSTYKGGDGR